MNIWRIFGGFVKPNVENGKYLEKWKNGFHKLHLRLGGNYEFVKSNLIKLNMIFEDGDYGS